MTLVCNSCVRELAHIRIDVDTSKSNEQNEQNENRYLIPQMIKTERERDPNGNSYSKV